MPCQRRLIIHLGHGSLVFSNGPQLSKLPGSYCLPFVAADAVVSGRNLRFSNTFQTQQTSHTPGQQWRTERGVWGVQTPPRNSEDIGGLLDRTSKKNRRLDFLL